MSVPVASERVLTDDQIRQVLERRAKELARTSKEDVVQDFSEFIIVTIGLEKLALEIRSIQEIQTLRGLTSVPGANDVWSGVVNLRGRLLPVLDLARTLGIPSESRETNSGGRIVVVSLGQYHMGLLVEDVLGVKEIPNGSIRPSLVDSSSQAREIISGITADMISVLDLNALASDPRVMIQE
jgi:purine-binding chemotaxis protein CheW